MSTTPQPKPGVAQAIQAERLTFPGLIPQEVVIFSAWWAIHKDEYTAADFNVRVGSGFDPGPAFDPGVRKAQIFNSQRRLDALLTQGSALTIAEVKYRATPLAVGQLLTYRALYAKDHHQGANAKLLLIYFQIDQDTVYCAQQLGVELAQQPADFTGIKITKQG